MGKLLLVFKPNTYPNSLDCSGNFSKIYQKRTFTRSRQIVHWDLTANESVQHDSNITKTTPWAWLKIGLPKENVIKAYETCTNSPPPPTTKKMYGKRLFSNKFHSKWTNIISREHNIEYRYRKFPQNMFAV